MCRRWATVKIPTEAENRDLVRRSQEGDERARDECIRRNTPLAIRLAHRHGMSFHDTEDLIQMGLIGLDKAITDYDPDRGASFVTYAQPKMRAEMGHWRRRQGLVMVPRQIQYDRTVGRVRLMKNKKVHRSHELAMRRAEFALEPTIPIEATDADVSLIPDHDPLELDEQIKELRTAVATLDDREREILFRRFREGHLLRQIGDDLELSKERVRQIERSSLNKLRKALMPKGST
jgi:RNA polymerase sporulation-specific sigma factor